MLNLTLILLVLQLFKLISINWILVFLPAVIGVVIHSAVITYKAKKKFRIQ